MSTEDLEQHTLELIQSAPTPSAQIPPCIFTTLVDVPETDFVILNTGFQHVRVAIGEYMKMLPPLKVLE